MNWNKLKQDMDGHPSEVDVNELWAAIEPNVDALNGKRKRRGLLWFWWLGAGLLVVALSGVFLWNNMNENTVTNEPVSELNSHTNTTQNATTETANIPTNNAANAAKNTTTETPIVEETMTNESGTELPQKAGVNSDTNTATNSVRNTDHAASNKGVNTSSKNATNSNTYKGETYDNDTQNTDNQLIKNFISTTIDKSVLENGLTTNANSADLNTIKNATTLVNQLPILNTNLDANNTTNNLTISAIMNTILAENKAELAEQKEDNKDDKKTTEKDWNLAIGMTTGISYADKNMAAKNDNSISLFQQRDSTENSLETSHFGAQFQARHQSGWGITTGLQRTTINERVDKLTTTIEEDINEGITSFIVTYHQDSIPIFGEVATTRTFTREQKYYKQYQLWEVPVLVSFQREMNEKWAWGAQIGTYINISQKAKGNTLGIEGEPVALENRFKSNIGLSIGAGAFVERQLNEKWTLKGSLNGRSFLQDFSVEDNFISQKYNLIGGHIGAYYRF